MLLRNGRLSPPDELMELGVLAHERASAALLVRSLRWWFAFHDGLNHRSRSSGEVTQMTTDLRSVLSAFFSVPCKRAPGVLRHRRDARFRRPGSLRVVPGASGVAVLACLSLGLGG